MPTEPSTDHDLEERRPGALRRVTHAIAAIGSRVSTLTGRAPGAVHATQARASEITLVLQRLPDSTLRWLAAGSLGVAAGFQLAGAPRLVRAAGAAPALLMGAAIALRPADVRTNGDIRTVKGTVEAGRATPTGDADAEPHGGATQVQPSAPVGPGDVPDAQMGYRGEDQEGA